MANLDSKLQVLADACAHRAAHVSNPMAIHLLRETTNTSAATLLCLQIAGVKKVSSCLHWPSMERLPGGDSQLSAKCVLPCGSFHKYKIPISCDPWYKGSSNICKPLSFLMLATTSVLRREQLRAARHAGSVCAGLPGRRAARMPDRSLSKLCSLVEYPKLCGGGGFYSSPKQRP